MTSLAIFDIDGTLTDTNAVDDACYRAAVAEAIGIAESAIDWSETPHFTDRGIFDWLFSAHRHTAPSASDVSRASARLAELLTTQTAAAPTRFAPIAGAPLVFDHLASNDWCVSIATGCWLPSARIKLSAAGIDVDDALIACADDAASRADIVTLSLERAREFYRRDFSRIVSIGDGTWDVTTASELGLPFVGVGHGDRADRLYRLGASTVIENYADLALLMSALDRATVPA